MFLNKMRLHEHNPVDRTEWRSVMGWRVFQPGQENHSGQGNQRQHISSSGGGGWEARDINEPGGK